MKQYDIEYNKLESGAIRLKQDDYGSIDTIDLHPVQLRAIAEHFGLVAPMPPADALAKRLAEQLCAAYLTLLDEQRYWSPRLESLWERLDAQIDCLPDEIFPHHLWKQCEEQERKVAEKRASACQQLPKSGQAACDTQKQASCEGDASDTQICLSL